MPGPLVVVVLGLLDGSGGGGRGRGGGDGGRRAGGAVVGDGLGLRVPEVEVAGGAIDEAPPGLGQRRIFRRVARRRGRHSSSQPLAIGGAGARGVLAAARRTEEGVGEGALGVALWLRVALCCGWVWEPFPSSSMRGAAVAWLSRVGGGRRPMEK